MTDYSVSVPDRWTATTSDRMDPGFTYRRAVSEAASVVLGLAVRAGSVQLRVTAIDDATTLRRQTFLVDEFETKRAAIEGLEAFADTIESDLTDADGPDESLYEVVEREIGTFQRRGSLLSKLFR